MHVRHLVALPLSLVLIGCAQTQTYTPRPSPVRVELRSLQSGQVAVEVNDLRAEREPGSQLADLVRTQIESALGRGGDPVEPAARHRLIIDVIEHRSFFDLGNWNGATRFRARIVSPTGNTAGPWEATGSARRSNVFGNRTAAAVSQDAYNTAIADLLSTLNAATPPR